MLADVKTAFLYGDARRSSYVELPPEDPLAASGRYVGKLERAMRPDVFARTPSGRHHLTSRSRNLLLIQACFNMRLETILLGRA